MSNIAGSPIQVAVGAPPRGSGTQAPNKFSAQRLRGSFAWGSSPATATLVYPGAVPVTTGALVNLTIGNHYFAGVCKSDTLVQGSAGSLRTLEFVDMRYFLTWDWVFGAFNLPDVRLLGGLRMKRYKHIYPANYGVYQWTYTNTPLTALQILNAILAAPTVFTRWYCDLTSNGLFLGGLLNGPIYEIDCLSGMRLDSVLSLICEKTGLVFCHDPRPGADFRLVWTRKGYGVLPIPFPTNADNRRQGTTLTENATNICVLGDRNRYQVLEVPMIKDWATAWEQFLEVDVLAQDIFDHETNPVTLVRYNAYPGDTDQWQGYNDAKTRALQITVSEYCTMRNNRDGLGTQFRDLRKYAGRWRMDMPAALYIQTIVFRAFKPNISGVDNYAGQLVPLDSANIADELLCRTYYDPVEGTMTVDLPPQPADGNGVFIAKGYQVGQDLFRLVEPDRMNAAFFSSTNCLWSQVQFQIDDSGEGVRFIIADAPVFTSDNLLTTVDGNVVLNAGYTLQTPTTKAALVFEAERYVYWKGDGLIFPGWAADPTKPLPGRNRVEAVNGLNQEFVVDASGDYTEVTYADNLTANAKAQVIASSLLLNQPFYIVGGYDLKWNPKLPLKKFGTPLAPGNSSNVDRVEISVGPDGIMEVVDFTSERQRNYFEPERELDRRSLQNSLFPGQQELRQEARDNQRLGAVLRSTPERLFSLFRQLLRGEVDGNLFPIKFTAGSSVPSNLPVGTPVVRQPAATLATALAVVGSGDSVFVGVTVRHNEGTGSTFYVQHTGDTLARVQGPVAANDPVGLAGSGSDFGTNGAYLIKGGTPGVGTVLTAIGDTSIKTVKVRLGAGGGGGGGGNAWL